MTKKQTFIFAGAMVLAAFLGGIVVSAFSANDKSNAESKKNFPTGFHYNMEKGDNKNFNHQKSPCNFKKMENKLEKRNIEKGCLKKEIRNEAKEGRKEERKEDNCNFSEKKNGCNVNKKE